ncbi:MAG TPA: EAL domain-containing protein [Solirubrobacteraceae bacterium]|nr:EAL domain-containing protein [Solirubrobacteraceae bacterium]
MPGPYAEVLVGRQPIFDRNLDVVGYELLFRSGPENRARVEDSEEATASVVIGSLTEIGLERLVGARPAWINVSREFLVGGLAETMPSELTVLEILEDEAIDDHLVAAVRRLRRHGFRVALDDFAYTPETERLLPYVDVVKLDVQSLRTEGVHRQMQELRRFGVTVLAEKVETHEEHTFCLEVGCELFQGFFFCRPDIVRDRKISAARLAVLQFISRLQDPEIAFDELEQMIIRDVAFSYRLLRYVNSAFFGLRQVSSISQALVLLGVENLKRWATLSLFASVEGKPQELTVTALVRARFCELAGAGVPNSSAGELFTLGLFSVIDALMDCPIEEVLASTPFPDEMRVALITRAGAKGELLACVSLLETGRLDEARMLVEDAGRLYLESIIWAEEATGPLFDVAARPAA